MFTISPNSEQLQVKASARSRLSSFPMKLQNRLNLKGVTHTIKHELIKNINKTFTQIINWACYRPSLKEIYKLHINSLCDTRIADIVTHTTFSWRLCQIRSKNRWKNFTFLQQSYTEVKVMSLTERRLKEGSSWLLSLHLLLETQSKTYRTCSEQNILFKHFKESSSRNSKRGCLSPMTFRNCSYTNKKWLIKAAIFDNI